MVKISGSLYKCFRCEKGELSEKEVKIIKEITKNDMNNNVCGTEMETEIFFVCQNCKDRISQNQDKNMLELGSGDDLELEKGQIIFPNEIKKVEKILNDLFKGFKNSKEFQYLNSKEKKEAESTITLFGEIMYKHHFQKPEDWDPIQIKSCCTKTLILIVSDIPQFFMSLCPILKMFFRFIKQNKLLPNSKNLPNNLTKTHNIVLERFNDPNYWSDDKRSFMSSMEPCVDIYQD
ncbi:MAG: hypothetical protein GF329_03045 [Candidatus Lokiarchaeota archaeon]|nr:hypothetical protein [Candidatus Lokiarchaeota archaeon]